MLRVYRARGAALEEVVAAPGGAADASGVWFDLLRPESEEAEQVEALTGIDVPTAEALNEIEISSRLYFEDGVRYMTVPLLVDSETAHFRLSNIAFILTPKHVVTVRHDEPTSIRNFAARLCREPRRRNGGPAAQFSAEHVLVGLVDAVVDRTADIIERVGSDIDTISRRIFGRESTARRQKDYMAVIRMIGQKGDLLSLALESLVGLSRLVSFLSADLDGARFGRELKSQIKALGRDAASLREHAIYLGDKVTFLLDAVVGMVTIEQNNLVKIFSVVAVILMPPTLIASTYGMNFRDMPELSLPLGYPVALLAMIISAIVPFLFFRWKNWL